MGIDGINSKLPYACHLHISQNGQIELLKSNNNHLSFGTKIDTMADAQSALEGGQNVTQVMKNPKIPRFLSEV